MQEKICNLGGRYDALKIIESIEFTTREIDIIACVLSGWVAHKSIAAFLTTPSQTISPRTVETHLRNIMRKIGCLSQSGIIDYIEKSAKRSVVQSHYEYLQTQINFERKLATFYRYLYPKQLCAIYEDNQKDLLQLFLQHLALTGIKTIKNENKAVNTNLNNSEHYLYVVSKELISQFESDKKEKKLAISKHLQQAITEKQGLTFLLFDNTIRPIPEEFPKVGILMENQENYYVMFFKLLHRIDPTLELEQTILEFTKTIAPTHQKFNKAHISKEKVKFSPFTWAFWKKKKKWIIPLITTSSAFLYLIDWFFEYHNVAKQQHPTRTSIHSNLLVPLGKNLLQRPHLMKQIEDQLNVNGGKELRIVALAGIGGAGKTTLSIQYAMQQKESFIWEVNAETVSTLMHSFEKMAFALCQTAEDYKTLNSIKAIQNATEREEKILEFAKNKLQTIQNWLLIYDNVEKIADIQEYVPTDLHAWGSGRVILTTRDTHIQQNLYIHNTVFIDKLTSQEKLELFVKILNPEKKGTLFSKKATDQFLEKIDSFPLDVSVAAFYLKATGITYDQYLEELSHYTPSFIALQEQVLKDATHYVATRYSIICLSIDKLLKTHKDFAELILLISTIDSQNIPRRLLESAKDKLIVDNFIYCLKKYSLITDFSGGKSLEVATFSLHRSVQFLGRNFLLELLNEEEKRIFLSEIVASIESFYNFYTHEDCSLILLLIPHLEELAENIKTITLSKALKGQLLQRLSFILGYAYKRHSRNLMLEKKYFSQAYEMQIKTNYLPTLKLASLLKDLGSTCVDMENPDEAITYSQKSVALCQQIPNSTILTTDNFQIMGYAYAGKNDFENAEFFFKKALQAIAQAPSDDLKQESESDIYAMLGWLYSTTYIHGPKAQEGINYVKKALALVKGDSLFYKNPSKPKKTISRYVARHRTTLGDIYCRAGKYEEAFNEGFKEAQYVIDHYFDNSSHCYLLKVYIAIGMGEIYLRQNNGKLAKNKLMESIRNAKKLMGENTSLIFSPLVLCIEAKIRLGELAEAYEDCLTAFKIERKSKTNYSDLLLLTAHYHAAIIKYKQGDLKKAMSHFGDFFRESRAFCQNFLDHHTYHGLEEEKTFNIPPYQESNLSHNVKQCLQRSTKIFSAIYGNSHPFVQNYVETNMLR